MMSQLGKPLVFLNLFLAVGLLTWAGSLYAHHNDYTEKDAGASKKNEDPYADDTSNIERLQWKVENLSDAVKAAQVGYARSSASAVDAELIREYRVERYNFKIGEARTGAFKSLVYLPKSALIDLNAPGEPVLGVDKKPVSGIDNVQQALAKSIRDSDQFLSLGEKRRNDFKTLADEIDGLDTRIARQKEILVRLKEEFDYLSNRRTDWDEQVRTLNRRKAQVEAAVSALTGK